MAELRGDMAQLRGEMAEMRGDLRSEMAANLRIMVMAQIGTAFGLAGLMVGLG